MNNLNNRRVKGLTCFTCGLLIPGSYSNLTHHFKNSHRWKTGRSQKRKLVCGQNGCTIEVQDFSSYRNHLLRCPYIVNDSPSHDVASGCDSVSEPSNQENTRCGIEQFEENSDPAVGESDDIPYSEGLTTSVNMNSVSLLMLKLRAHYLVSHSALNFLVQEFNKVLTSVEKGELSVASLKETLQGLDSQKKRNAKFVSTFGLIQSQTKTLGTARLMRYNKKKKPFAFQKPKTYETISLKDTLESLFSIPSFRDLYFSERRSTDGFIRSSIDGEQCQSHPIFSTVPHSLRLQVYFDDIEPNNALGAKVRKHQIGAFLYKILNIPPWLNALLANIHRFAFALTKDLKERDFRFPFKSFMGEVRMLESEDGMTLILNGGQSMKLRGSIASVTGDAKALHEVFGLMSPSASKFCHCCLVKKKDILNHPTCANVTMRNRQNYGEAAEKANGKNDPATGIKFVSPLNESTFFNVGENHVLDEMHDFAEGVVPFLFKLCIKHLMNNHPEYGIYADTINTRITLFNFSYYDSANVPTAKFTDFALLEAGNYKTQQKAAQNMCLARMFPFLLGDLIDENNQYYLIFIELLVILGMMERRKYVIADTFMLESKIADIYESFPICFPGVEPINKWHHMIHYPKMLRQYGPISETSCIRYEGYLNIPKRVGKSTSNFVKFPKSTSEHCQIVACYNRSN